MWSNGNFMNYIFYSSNNVTISTGSSQGLNRRVKRVGAKTAQVGTPTFSCDFLGGWQQPGGGHVIRGNFWSMK